MSGLSRREFVGAAAAATASNAIAAGSALPAREFGRTGVRLPILAIGCGNRLWAAYKEKDRGLEALELALSLGIRYFDTAQAYGAGTSESWVGEATEGRRDEVFLATKTPARTYDDVLAEAEKSLQRLRTDRLDVLHLHSLKYEDDLASMEKNGAIRALEKLRSEKTIRFMGITSHTDPDVLASALERHDFDCTQMALNAGLQGRSPDGAGFWKKGGNSDIFGEPIPPEPKPGAAFEDTALPVAVAKRLGIIGMKVTGQEALSGDGPGQDSAARLLRYVLSLPVSVATIGMPELRMIRENVETVRAFQPMSRSEMTEMSGRIADAAKTALDRHFREEHRDA